MAVQLDNRLFTGGSERFDSTPSVNFYAQLMAKEKAKEEAFDEYIRNLNKGINSAGLRNQDRQAFDEKLKGWQDYMIQNRDAVRKRTGGADLVGMQKYQDLLNLIAESKQEEEAKKPLVEILTDPNKRSQLRAPHDDWKQELADPSVMTQAYLHDAPLMVKDEKGEWVRNPDRKRLDYSSLAFNPKPYDTGGIPKEYADIKRMDLTPVVVENPDMTNTVTTTSVFGPQEKEVIQKRAIGKLFSDPSYKGLIGKLKKDEYNQLFKDNYGRDIENEGDLAAAFDLSHLQKSVQTVKRESNTFARQKQMAAIQDQYAKGRLAMQQQYKKDLVTFRGAANKQDQDQVLEAWIQRTFNEGKDTYNPVMLKGKWVGGKQIATPMDLKKKYTIVTGKDDDGKDIKEMPRFVMTDDKKYVVPLYPGKKSDWAEPIPIETFRNELGKIWLSAKDRVGEMDEISFDNEDGVEDVTTVVTDTQEDEGFTRDEWKSAGWTDKQIDEASKSGKIKVK